MDVLGEDFVCCCCYCFLLAYVDFPSGLPLRPQVTYKFDVWLELCFGDEAVRLDQALPGQLREFRDVQRQLLGGGGCGLAGKESEKEEAVAAQSTPVAPEWLAFSEEPPSQARIVTFPLEPKPREAAAAGVGWVTRHWVL